MNPNTTRLWPAPPWALTLLLAMLGMLGPFSIDTYAPAFAAIGASTGASPAQLQQTFSAYLFGFAFMNLLHGALSDSFGRRPVVLCGLVVFTLASVGGGLSQSIGQLIFFRALQGLSTGAGIVVSRAVVRDLFPQAEAQRAMSQITIVFGIAPAIAPLVGGLLLEWSGWRAIFWLLVGIGAALTLANWCLLPETLLPAQRQPMRVGHLMHGYWQLLSDARFLLLALASGVPFNGVFLYVLSAPAYLGQVLRLEPTQFFWLFVLNIGGIMAGSWQSGRMAGKVPPRHQIMKGMRIMLIMSALNVAANALFTPSAWWALWPIAIYAYGWALMVPVVTLKALDLYPERRGMASSLQAVAGSAANGLVAGVLTPLVMHSAIGMALTAAVSMLVGLLAWGVLRRRWPQLLD